MSEEKKIQNPIDDGGPAYPCDQPLAIIRSDILSKYPQFGDDLRLISGKSRGFTKREAVAMAALQGMLSGMSYDINRNPDEALAEWAFNLADAFLKASKTAQNSTRKEEHGK